MKISDEMITDEMRMAVARALYNEEDINEMSCHPSTFEVIEAVYPLIAKAAKAEMREAAAKVAERYGWPIGSITEAERLAPAQEAGEEIAAAIRAMEVE